MSRATTSVDAGRCLAVTRSTWYTSTPLAAATARAIVHARATRSHGPPVASLGATQSLCPPSMRATLHEAMRASLLGRPPNFPTWQRVGLGGQLPLSRQRRAHRGHGAPPSDVSLRTTCSGFALASRGHKLQTNHRHRRRIHDGTAFVGKTAWA